MGKRGIVYKSMCKGNVFSHLIYMVMGNEIFHSLRRHYRVASKNHFSLVHYSIFSGNKSK